MRAIKTIQFCRLRADLDEQPGETSGKLDISKRRCDIKSRTTR